MNMSAKNMSDNESHEENEDIILKLKGSDKQPKKDKLKKLNNSLSAKLEPLVENSKILIISRWKKNQISKKEI
jgi:hypothetical protein